MTISAEVAHQLHSLRDYLRWITSQFMASEVYFGHGNADAFNEAAQLILHTLHLPVQEFPEQFADARLTDAEKSLLLQRVAERIDQRRPLPYILGEAWFAGLPFYVDERVLIPRSPFAQLIDEGFSPWIAEPESVQRVLDLCTGSGCIAIACAMRFLHADVDAVDLCADALAVARINVEHHGLQECITLWQSDVWRDLPSARYDLIVANPPYVGVDEMTTLPPEYRHEPQQALQADDNGLAIVEEILRHAADYLTEHGHLFVEVGNSDEAVQSRWPEMDFLWLTLDQGGHGIFHLTQAQCRHFQALYCSSATSAESASRS